MKSLETLLKEYKEKPEVKSERAEIIKNFFDELTLDRRMENYRRWKREMKKLRKDITPDEFKKNPLFLKPLTARLIAIKLSHVLDKSELYYFLSICRDYKRRGGSFSKIFFGALK